MPILERLSPHAWVEMNPRDARGCGCKPQDRVDVVSRRGRVRGVELRLTETIAPGQVFVPFHYAEANANQVTQSAFDPISREPNYKQSRCASNAPNADSGGRAMKQLVVVGNGMAGMACVEQILKYAPQFRDHGLRRRDARQLQPHPAVVGAGRREGGRRHRAQPLEWYQRNDIELRVGVRIIDVDRERKAVTGDDGSVTPYDTLLLATGSSRVGCRRSTGLDKDDVFAFRTSTTRARCSSASRPGLKAVVIGGGLLGLEAARGLQVQGCDVTVVHLHDTLMERQLDPDRRLLPESQDGGPRRPRAARPSTKAILGNGTGRRRRSSPTATMRRRRPRGRRRRHPAERRARAQGRPEGQPRHRRQRLHGDVGPRHLRRRRVRRARGICYGLVAPLLEQGKVLPRRSPATKGPTYTGTVPAAKLKIMGVDVFSAGDWKRAETTEPVRYEDPALGIYKKLTLATASSPA